MHFFNLSFDIRKTMKLNGYLNIFRSYASVTSMLLWEFFKAMEIFSQLLIVLSDWISLRVSYVID